MVRYTLLYEHENEYDPRLPTRCSRSSWLRLGMTVTSLFGLTCYCDGSGQGCNLCTGQAGIRGVS